MQNSPKSIDEVLKEFLALVPKTRVEICLVGGNTIGETYIPYKLWIEVIIPCRLKGGPGLIVPPYATYADSFEDGNVLIHLTAILQVIKQDLADGALELA